MFRCIMKPTGRQSIRNTSAIGMVGPIEKVRTYHHTTFPDTEDLIYLIGETKADFNGKRTPKITKWVEMINGRLMAYLIY